METELLKFFLDIWMSTRIYNRGGPAAPSQGPKFLQLLTNMPPCLRLLSRVLSRFGLADI